MKETTSLCPTCYAEIPAEIFQRDEAAWMLKACPVHGPFEAMVERDYRWWLWCQQQEGKGIYDGYFVDITSRCNLKCKYCFHDRAGADRSLDDIMAELRTRSPEKAGQIILFGGEPTVHGQFFAVCEAIKAEFGAFSIVTNGVKTADPEFFKRLAGMNIQGDCGTTVHVSMHPESNGADLATLDNARAQGVQISSILCVIDNVDQIQDVVKLFDSYSDVVVSLRLKGACNIGAENKAPERIYTSDIIKGLSELGTIKHIAGDGIKNSFCNLLLNDRLHIMPVSWYGIDNVDLQDIDTAPWYRAHDGNTYNLATALIVNEGVAKGLLPRGIG